ncbi:MAG: hypothetical protein KatS3mg076_0588 [Candidatus Binatia bacterium]|nr:MAG: hypothetical protein KatS3mg076_0588 [Candidatus Binatia bacterium]
MRSGPLSEASSGPVREPFSEASAGEPPGVGSAGSVKKASREPPRARIGQTFGDLEELQELLRERARASAGATKEQGVEREPVENEAPGSLRAAVPAVPDFPPAEEPSAVEARSAEMLVAPPENTLSPRGVETGREEVPGELSAP